MLQLDHHAEHPEEAGNRQLRCCHVASWNVEGVSGLAKTVPDLCKSLSKLDCDVELQLLKGRRLPSLDESGIPTTEYSKPYRLGKLNFSKRFSKYMLRNQADIDIVHIHSLWRYESCLPYFLRKNAKIVCSPRGTLSDSAMAFGSKAKKLLWNLIQRRVLNACSFVHVTSEAELRDVRRRGVNVPLALIPNGVEMPSNGKAINGQPHNGHASNGHPSNGHASNGHASNGQASHFNNNKKLLFVGRIHPIKNLDLLLNAWEVVHSEFKDWKLEIVGDDVTGGEYKATLMKYVDANRINRVSFEQPAFGDKLRKKLSESSVGILISKSENFGMAAAEFMATGVPVMVSKTTPWKEVVSHDCGRLVDSNLESVSSGLRNLMRMDRTTLHQMGKRGRDWMETEYSWEKVAQKMYMTYLWALKKGPRPSWVFEKKSVRTSSPRIRKPR